jgi:hypothetical protein
MFGFTGFTRCITQNSGPITHSSMHMTWFSGQTFVLENNSFKDLKVECWLLPRFKTQV